MIRPWKKPSIPSMNSTPRAGETGWGSRWAMGWVRLFMEPVCGGRGEDASVMRLTQRFGRRS